MCEMTSMLLQAFNIKRSIHVPLASETQTVSFLIDPNDADRYIWTPTFCQTKHHYKCVDRQVVDASLILCLFFAGKYPHVIVSSAGKPPTTLNHDTLEAVIQFGPTAVGTSVTKMVELHNLAPVSYSSWHPKLPFLGCLNTVKSF